MTHRIDATSSSSEIGLIHWRPVAQRSAQAPAEEGQLARRARRRGRRARCLCAAGPPACRRVPRGGALPRAHTSARKPVAARGRLVHDVVAAGPVVADGRRARQEGSVGARPSRPRPRGAGSRSRARTAARRDAPASSGGRRCRRPARLTTASSGPARPRSPSSTTWRDGSQRTVGPAKAAPPGRTNATTSSPRSPARRRGAVRGTRRRPLRRRALYLDQLADQLGELRRSRQVGAVARVGHLDRSDRAGSRRPGVRDSAR